MLPQPAGTQYVALDGHDGDVVARVRLRLGAVLAQNPPVPSGVPSPVGPS